MSNSKSEFIESLDSIVDKLRVSIEASLDNVTTQSHFKVADADERLYEAWLQSKVISFLDSQNMLYKTEEYVHICIDRQLSPHYPLSKESLVGGRIDITIGPPGKDGTLSFLLLELKFCAKGRLFQPGTDFKLMCSYIDKGGFTRPNNPSIQHYKEKYSNNMVSLYLYYDKDSNDWAPIPLKYHIRHAIMQARIYADCVKLIGFRNFADKPKDAYYCAIVVSGATCHVSKVSQADGHTHPLSSMCQYYANPH